MKDLIELGNTHERAGATKWADTIQKAVSELDARRVDAAQFQRMIDQISGAMPHFATAFGAPCDHAEAALARMIEERQRLGVALDCLYRLAIRAGICPPGERRCEMDAAREALIYAGAPKGNYEK